MGYAEWPEAGARVWYVRRHEDGQREQGYWYCETRLEARVLRDRLLDDEAIVETGIDVKLGDAWRGGN